MKAYIHEMAMVLALFAGVTSTNAAEIAPVVLDTTSSVSNDMPVVDSLELVYAPIDNERCIVKLDEWTVISTTNLGSHVWQPTGIWSPTITYCVGTNVWKRRVKVKSVAWPVTPKPSPPTDKDDNISLDPTNKTIVVEGGSGTIVTSGSGTWNAAASESWITIPEALSTRTAGLPVVYQVAANAAAEKRTGYVYVSGHVFTIVQAGRGATLDGTSAEYECDGGSGRVSISVNDETTWIAKPANAWLSVSPVSGKGNGEVAFVVAPWHEATVRTGTITIGGKTFTVKQYGRRVGLNKNMADVDYKSQSVDVAVTAIATEEWTTSSEVDWLSVSLAKAVGDRTIQIHIGENTSYLPREGYVRIGTERFRVCQAGRTAAALTFDVSVRGAPASENGGKIVVDVVATPDLPWTMRSDATWIEVGAGEVQGSGCRSVECSVGVNTTLQARSGALVVVPAADSGLAAKNVSVKQKAAVSKISAASHGYPSEGGTYEVQVTVSNRVEWTVENTNGWITIVGAKDRVGPGTVLVSVSSNPTVSPRSATIQIAKQTFRVDQKGDDSLSVDQDVVVVGKKDGFGSVKVVAENGIGWTACSSDPSWLCVLAGQNCDYDAHGNVIGVGDGTIEILVTDYNGESSRIGYITIGSVKITIIQCESDYVVHFDANGGQGSMSDTYGLKAEDRTLPESGFTKSGYEFAGWTSGENIAARWQPGDHINTIVDELGKDVTLYAYWNWMPQGVSVVAKEVTGGRDLTVNANWITGSLASRYGASVKDRFQKKFGDDFAKALLRSTTKVDGREMFVWEDYVAGTDPTDSNSVFKAKVRVENGLPVIEWEPNLNSNGAERVYTIYGKESLSDPDWMTPTNEQCRFFKVGVDMPQEDGPNSPDDPDSPGKSDGKSIVKAKLVHRWSFNGNLTDSVGGQTATVCGSSSGGVSTDGASYTLPGGGNGLCYIDLGSGIIPVTTNGATVEIWATRNAASKASRVFDFGSGTKNYLCWTWQNLDSEDSDITSLRYDDSSVAGAGTTYGANTPFVIAKEYHVSVTIKYVSDGHWVLTFQKRISSSGTLIATRSISTAGTNWCPSSLGQTKCFLGHSQWSADFDAAASYNECRIWDGVLSDDELNASCVAGPTAAIGLDNTFADAVYDPFLNSSYNTLWSDIKLSSVTNIVGFLSGKGINDGTNAVRVVGCCFKDESDGKSVQFQAVLGNYVKCVKVRLQQNGEDVTGYVQYAGCLDKSYGLGVDFDTENYTPKFVATSDSDEWYGVKNLCVFVSNE